MIYSESFTPLKKVGNYGTLMQTTTGGFSFPGARKLSEVCKLPLLQRENAEEIKNIWSTQHSECSTAVGDVISVEQYELFKQRAGKRLLYIIIYIYICITLR